MARRVPPSDRARCILLVKELMEGQQHSRQSVAKLLGTSLRTADRWMRLAERIPGVERTRGVLAYRPMKLAQANVIALAAAYLGGDLGAVMGDSRWGSRLRELADHLTILAGSPDARKFLFVAKEQAQPSARDDVLDAITGAIWDSTVLRFNHRDDDGNVRRYRVQPLSLLVHERELHLLARVASGEEASRYRIADITNVAVDRATFEYPPAAEYEPEAALRASLEPRRAARPARGESKLMHR